MALQKLLDQNSLIGQQVEEDEKEKERDVQIAPSFVDTTHGRSQLSGRSHGLEAIGLPLCHAHPLHGSSSHPTEWELQQPEEFVSLRKEQFLRRKTPNGVLDASYDGTLDDQTGKTQAMRYKCLPTAPKEYQMSAGPSVFCQWPSMEAQNVAAKPAQVPLPDLKQLQRASTSNKARKAFKNFSSSMTSNTAPLLQIDSLLHQASDCQILGLERCVSALPEKFQPTPNIPTSPTTSNDGGPYGPYWPNGTFIPYRPAALRDTRFSPQSNKVWPVQNSSLLERDFQYNIPQQRMGSVRKQVTDAMQTQLQTPVLFASGLSVENSDLLYPSEMVAHRSASCDLASVYSHKRTINFDGSTLRENRYLNDKTNRTNINNNARTDQLSTPQNHIEVAQLRQSCLAWAHCVYIDLLAFIDQSKRSSQRKRALSDNQFHRPSIYPKPPRKPSIDHFRSLPLSTINDIKSSHQHTIPASKSLLATKLAGCTDREGREIMHRAFISQPMSAKAGRMAKNECWQSSEYLNGGMKEGSYNFLYKDRSIRSPSSGYDALSSSSGLAANVGTHNFRVVQALDRLSSLCAESNWKWVEGMLLAGCLAYALTDYHKALQIYSKILKVDSCHVEAISNSAASFLALNRHQEAEKYWYQAVNLRPAYFEAVEHLVGLLCGENRGKEAIDVIEYVERSLRCEEEQFHSIGHRSGYSFATSRSVSMSNMCGNVAGENEENDLRDGDIIRDSFETASDGYASSGYAIPGSENGRILALIHAKGNMLYALGDNAGAARAFERAVMIGIGKRAHGIKGLIQLVLKVIGYWDVTESHNASSSLIGTCPVLLPPEGALLTAVLCFPSNGELPGLKYIPLESLARKAAISTTSNSLLSLAKIYQDGMTTCASSTQEMRCSSFGVREILALYYLSLSLQPSPSTANNVGILLASVQQTTNAQKLAHISNSYMLNVPGVVPGSGVALALMYYNYGLNLDPRHAHLFTNLGSLLKDIGQLSAAIKMYEQAVACDANFDIALANLANAVKDQGRIGDAIIYYKRAVSVNPDFAEAVCGLANALNSVCSWHGRGGITNTGGKVDLWHVDKCGMLLDGQLSGMSSSGWLKRVIDLVDKQLADGKTWARDMADAQLVDFLAQILCDESTGSSTSTLGYNYARSRLRDWLRIGWEGAKLVWVVERSTKRLTWRWYQDAFVYRKQGVIAGYLRPQLPAAMTVPSAPTVLPFHTFTCPMNAEQIRQIAQRNGLRISCLTLKAPWLPKTVYPPPHPPQPHLNIGYVSSDFNNHPLAHLMQSVFGMHDRRRVKAFCYATAQSDNSIHRRQIEREAPVFHDASTWSAEGLINQIVRDGIHILVNLNGYTRGAKNEIFAARPAPIQMSFMGFAGTLGAQWCDYILADEISIPTETLRPWRSNVGLADMIIEDHGQEDDSEWIYGENIIYCRDTFFCCDHRQSAPDAQEGRKSWKEEQERRLIMRRSLFPNLPDDYLILGNFNQLYKIDPTIFRTWLRILARIPRAVLWLLRFPDLGETHLKQTARIWASPDVASRIIFTDVAPKDQHISRACVCDLFLDTAECNAHTTAADVLWSGTPLLTLPRHKYKMCSRMAASIVQGALPKSVSGRAVAKELIVNDEIEYEEAAVRLAKDYQHITEMTTGKICGRLAEIRKLLLESRWSCPLFDTRRWVRDLEKAYCIAWDRWVTGQGGDIWL